jgi:hypothetical protein
MLNVRNIERHVNVLCVTSPGVGRCAVVVFVDPLFVASRGSLLVGTDRCVQITNIKES